MLERLDGRFLVTFLAVWKEGTISGAAAKLGYVQSTVTAHIQLLEQSCGQKLFHRLPRGVKPTEAGEKLARYARQFAQLGQSLQEALNSLEQPRGAVWIRALESFYVTRLTGLFRPFLAQYPEVSLHLETGFQGDIVEQVLSHSIDFGIVPKNPMREELLFEPLIEEKMVLISSAELARTIAMQGWEQLQGVQVIGFGPRCLYQTDGYKILTEMGMPAEIRQAEFPSTELIRQLIKNGMGIAYVPEIALERELAEGTVVALPMTQPLRLTHGLLQHRDRVLNTPAKVFRQELLDYFNESTSRLKINRS
ncbi:LysR family transcriptional regulator [Paenibacillus montaniterrae]|uniref:LysR family transcriptional regulator n=1 Tax=Paenibacillus montaniterrae TaxID=429341 RepID=A0A920CXQ4_9BACL|nr:LysR family transcriptional regulator [Paenibacillus montaniterrae]GIP16565.1 LysR family transcriptional regulator [Paenibacillus montaniterrae]